MKNHIIISLTLILILKINIINAQTNDFEIWTGAKITKEITDRLDLSYNEEIRLNENASSFDKIFSDIGVNYKLSYKFEIGLFYRFINARELNSTYNNEHRYYFDLGYTERFSRLKLTYRTRFQSKYSNMYSSDGGLIPSNYFRNKLSAEYDLKNTKFNPLASLEMYYRLNGPNNNTFNKLRLKIGTEYEISKKGTFEIYYMLQNEFNVVRPVNSYILGISYSFKF